MFDYIYKCQCGAISVTIENIDYSMTEETFKNKFGEVPEIEADIKCNCNHCVNHWGIDLCACGSGEHFNVCRLGFDECGQPMQNIEEGFNHVTGGNPLC